MPFFERSVGLIRAIQTKNGETWCDSQIGVEEFEMTLSSKAGVLPLIFLLMRLPAEFDREPKTF